MVTNVKEDRCLPLKDAASQLGVSMRGLYRLISKGDLPQPLKIGRRSYLTADDVQTYIRKLKEGRR